MNLRQPNRLLLLAAALISLHPFILPLVLPQFADQAFTGTDDQARNQILALAPAYQPWFAPLLTPPGPETSGLLFTLQAALGSGILGYWLGTAVTRARNAQAAATPPPGDAAKDGHAD